MEASDQQDPSQTGEANIDGADGTQDASSQQSQEQPTQDSGLQTPQPDQPVPAEGERTAPQAETAPDAAQAAQPVDSQSVGQPPAPFPTNVDQESAAVDRERELEADRRAHNERTGGGEIQPNEVQDTRQEHNDRTGGGQIPGTSEPEESEQPES